MPFLIAILLLAGPSLCFATEITPDALLGRRYVNDAASFHKELVFSFEKGRLAARGSLKFNQNLFHWSGPTVKEGLEGPYTKYKIETSFVVNFASGNTCNVPVTLEIRSGKEGLFVRTYLPYALPESDGQNCSHSDFIWIEDDLPYRLKMLVNKN